MNIISLGAGVQSSTMALMAAHGEITPMPDAAIFADTQAEPKAVYEWLDWLEKQLPFPVYRVSEGNLGDEIRNPVNGRISHPPFFTMGKDGVSPIGQDCTRDYKVYPIRQKIRALLKQNAERQAILWLGISTDEASRMKESNRKYIINRYSLIDKFMSRQDCLTWMRRHGYPEPPKSACVFCPWTSPIRWRDRKLNHPDEFQMAVDVDKAIRHGLPGINGEAFVHRSLMPLDQVDFSTDEDRGQLNMFNNECEGMCGV